MKRAKTITFRCPKCLDVFEALDNSKGPVEHVRMAFTNYPAKVCNTCKVAERRLASFNFRVPKT